jgi:hypothetical protein
MAAHLQCRSSNDTKGGSILGKSIKLKFLALCLVPLFLVACDKQEKAKEVVVKQEPPKPVSMLTLVPDDTIFFSGVSEPFPFKEFMQWNASHFKLPSDLNTKELLKTEKELDTDGQRMAVQLWQDYIASVMSPGMQIESWGFDDTPTFASYAIGLSPVLLRISLKDVQRFNNKIAELEEKAKVKTKPETLGQATFHRYSLSKQEPQVSLIIGVDGSNAVFMIDIGVDSQQTLSLALGQNKPEKSLLQSGRLPSLQEKYKLGSSWLAYIDHQQLIKGLTTKDGNRMAKMLQLLALQSKDANNKKQLDELQTEGCRTDLQAMGTNWPQTVAGYTALDLKAKPSRINSIMVVESNDKSLLEGLKSLRGFVPDYKGIDAAFSFGLGLNVENIAPVVLKQWTEITQKQYNCGPLKEMQTALKEKNPAAASIATSMVAGVRGIAFSLFSLTMDKAEAGGTPMPKDLDAVISLSAKDPVALVQMAAAMLPQVEALKIPADGTPVNLPLPIPLPFTPMAAINGSHLTVYAGKQAEQTAKALGKASLDSSSGFMAGAIDYGRYYGLIADVMPALGKNDASTTQAMTILEAVRTAKMRLLMDMDFTDRGIEVKADMVSTD